MKLLVRLSMFFISFRGGFLTSDVMIGGTSDESGLVFFSEGCWSWCVELYRTALKRYRSSVFHFCPFVLHFLYLSFLVSFFSLLSLCVFWTSTPSKYSFNIIYSFLL